MTFFECEYMFFETKIPAANFQKNLYLIGLVKICQENLKTRSLQGIYDRNFRIEIYMTTGSSYSMNLCVPIGLAPKGKQMCWLVKNEIWLGMTENGCYPWMLCGSRQTQYSANSRPVCWANELILLVHLSGNLRFEFWISSPSFWDLM
jgi:hypothetical protein